MKTTKKDFAYFKSRCQYWLDYFKISEWAISFSHEDFGDSYAWTSTLPTAKDVRIGLAINHKIKSTFKDIDRLAFHEVCELMLSDLSWYGSEYFSQGIINEETHRIINRLENTIYKEST